MKRGIRLLCLVLALLLLCSCASRTAAPKETGKEAETEAKKAGEADAVPLEGLTDFGTNDYTFPLWQCDEFRLELLVFLSENGALCWMLRGIPFSEEEIVISCDNFRTSEGFSPDCSASLYLEDGKTKVCDLFASAPLGDIVPTDFSADFRAKIGATTLEQKIEWTQPEDFCPHPICEPYREARALTQVLEDNERVKITLLCLGSTYSFDSFVFVSVSEQFGGILLVENKTDETIPVKIPAATVNGLSLTVYHGDTIWVPAKMQSLLPFSIEEPFYDEEEAESVFAVSLQILTDVEENTGNNHDYFYAGGKWYSIALDQAGTASIPEPGEIIYEDDYLQISILGFETEGGYYATDDYQYEHELRECRWKLLLVNKSEQDLELDVAATQLNGVDESLPIYFQPINANGYLISERYVTIPIDDETPEVRFWINVCTQGRGSILYTVDDPIILPPMEAESE